MTDVCGGQHNTRMEEIVFIKLIQRRFVTSEVDRHNTAPCSIEHTAMVSSSAAVRIHSPFGAKRIAVSVPGWGASMVPFASMVYVDEAEDVDDDRGGGWRSSATKKGRGNPLAADAVRLWIDVDDDEPPGVDVEGMGGTSSNK